MTDGSFEHLRTVSDHDGGIILDLRRGTVSLLNPTAAYVWERFREGLKAQEIVRNLAELTGTPEEVVSTDLAKFLEQLNRTHLEDDEVAYER